MVVGVGVSTPRLHGYPHGVVSVGESPVAYYRPDAPPNFASEDAEARRPKCA
jgi:hypothetical protein